MVWPLGPLSVTVIATVTAGVSLLAAFKARQLRLRTESAQRSQNPARIAATQRDVSRAWGRHRAFVLPTVLTGIALLITQGVACVTALLPH